MVAGSSPVDSYIINFIKNQADKYGYELTGRMNIGGEGWTSFHKLKKDGKKLPVFYCSVSPSDWSRRSVLPDRIEEKQKELLRLLR